MIVSTRPLPVRASGDVVQDFDLPAGVVRVTVVDDLSGKPVPRSAVIASPEERGADADRFSGFSYRPGWSAFADESSVALLLGLPSGVPHEVEGGVTAERRMGKLAGVRPGTAASPVEVTLRVRKD